MTRGTSKRLSWQGSHNRYKKSSAIYKEAYEKIFKKKITNESEVSKMSKGKYHKVIIELEFDTFKPNEDDVFKYIKDLYEDNSLGYKILNSKNEEI